MNTDKTTTTASAPETRKEEMDWQKLGTTPEGYHLWTKLDETGREIFKYERTQPKATEGGYYNAESAAKLKNIPMPHGFIPQRTIPAEKPTEASWNQIRCEELQRDYASACIRADDAKAQAAQLAEALSLSKIRFERGSVCTDDFTVIENDLAEFLGSENLPLTPQSQPQHSPLPTYWKEGLHGFTESERQTIIRAVNHADKLAEALRDILQWFSEPYDPSPKSLPVAREALAAYEKAKG